MKGKKLFTLTVTALATLFAITSCDDPSTSTSGEAEYTYNTYLNVNPKTWNNHTWETSDESYIMGFTEMGLYDCILNETKDGYTFVNEMASARPVDVSKNLSDNELDTYYANVGNPSDGLAWEIKLNENAVWEDGSPITADTYVQSMERQLNPKLINRRADSYYGSNFVIVNAERYFKQQRTTIEPVFNYISDSSASAGSPTSNDSNLQLGDLYINLGAPTPYAQTVFSNAEADTSFYTVLNNRSTRASDAVELAAQRITDACSYLAFVDYKTKGATGFANPDEWEDVEKLADVSSDLQLNYDIDVYRFDDEDVYVRTTVDKTMVIDPEDLENSDISVNDPSTFELYSYSALKQDISTVVAELGAGRGVYGATWNWMLPLFANYFNNDKLDFGSVGIRKIDDYTIRIYLEKQITQLDLLFSLTGNWIVNVELYDSLTKTAGGVVTTAYATGSEQNYMSYGPYKLASFRDGSSIDIVKNDKWYGWTDGKHENQYQTTRIHTTIIQEHQTARQEFLNGNLDDLTLDKTDTDLQNSLRAKQTPESYTSKLSFNTSETRLTSRESSGVEKQIFANDNFRQGLSLAINRTQVASNSAGSSASVYLLNSLYLTDVEKGEVYRDTAQGKSVYGMVYKDLVEQDDKGNFKNSTGYNAALGYELVAKAVREQIEAGKMNANDKIVIELQVYDASSTASIGLQQTMNTIFTEIVNNVRTLLANPTEAGVEPITLGDNFGIRMDLRQDTNYYNNAQNGNYDAIISTWGGAAINPWNLMQVYCDPTFTQCCEYKYSGWQNDYYFDIDVNGDGVISDSEHRSMAAWYTYLVDEFPERLETEFESDEEFQEAYAERHNQRLNILAGIEAGVISQWNTIPLYARGSINLTSFKVNDGTDNYINLIGYGGIRFITYNYTDAEWTNAWESGDIRSDDYFIAG